MGGERKDIGMRIDGRAAADLRPIDIVPGFLRHPQGSALISCGQTRVLCSAMVAEEVPPWMRQQKRPGGWVTGEYAMLPAATSERGRRETAKPNGRSMEIQRLIGRCLRAAIDLDQLGPRTLYVDCDVLDADGGTRCAAVTGAMVAVEMAVAKLMAAGILAQNPVRQRIAAVSVGIVDGETLLDLCYQEDVRADVDMNVVMTDDGRLVEVQATAEGEPFPVAQFDALLALAGDGIRRLAVAQRDVLAAAQP
jgi:ribonuclease PH